MSSTEQVIDSIFSLAENASGFNTAVRGLDEVLQPSDLPCFSMAQGEESFELITMDGRMECTLEVEFSISCLKGSQSYETTLNNLKRNLMTAIRSTENFYQIIESSTSAPRVEQSEGESLFSMDVRLEVIYTRNEHDQINGED